MSSLRITAGTTVLAATLAYNPTARDFAALLPLTLSLRDYAGTEKISDLPRKLATADAPPGYQPAAGDLAYYAPWGNFALFYKDFSYSSGLIILGRLDAGLDHLIAATSEPIRFDLMP